VASRNRLGARLAALSWRPQGTESLVIGAILATGFGGSRLLAETICLKERTKMLWTLVVILMVMWLLGMATSYTMSGLIHVLLVIALIVVLVRVIQGRRVV